MRLAQGTGSVAFWMVEPFGIEIDLVAMRARLSRSLNSKAQSKVRRIVSCLEQ